MTLQQHHVLRVRLPRRVEDVAESGDHSHEGIDADVGEHSYQRHCRYLRPCRLEHDVTGQQAADQVADSRNETDYSVEPDAPACARNGDRVIEQLAEEANPLRPSRQLRTDLARLSLLHSPSAAANRGGHPPTKMALTVYSASLIMPR